MKNKQAAVLGAGSWGTSLSVVLNTAGWDVTLWTRNFEQADELNTRKTNSKYLGNDFTLPDSISVTTDLENAIKDRSLIVLSTPSHTIRAICNQIKPQVTTDTYICNTAKGIENQSLMLMSDVIYDVLGDRLDQSNISVLYGPSHAEEVSRLLPTTVVASSSSIKTAQLIRDAFVTDRFRVYSNDDLVGVEIGSAVKNIMAIAAGISDGFNFGDNAKAALMTRGMNEITRLGLALGAKKETFAGLTGIGDLIVTCMSRHSRNRRLGEMIGSGLTLDQALEKMTMVAEGVKTTKSTWDLAQKLHVEMPITEAVYKILFENKNPLDQVHELMTRQVKDEEWGN